MLLLLTLFDKFQNKITTTITNYKKIDILAVFATNLTNHNTNNNYKNNISIFSGY